MVSQLIEVEEYGSNKFLEGNPLHHVDVGLIHVLWKNISWRLSNYDSSISSMQSFEKESKTVLETMNKDF